MPTNPNFEIIHLKKDNIVAIFPENHPLTKYKKVPISILKDEPLILSSRAGATEVSQIFEQNSYKVKSHISTRDDYAIMAMVERGFGVGILPQLVLARIPYQIVVKELDVSASRDIVFAVRSYKNASLLVKRFIEYLEYMEN